MNPTPTSDPLPAGYELRFVPLSDAGHTYVFPCDARGRVDIDQLSARTRHDYYFARTLIGRDFSRPAVAPRLH